MKTYKELEVRVKSLTRFLANSNEHLEEYESAKVVIRNVPDKALLEYAEKNKLHIFEPDAFFMCAWMSINTQWGTIDIMGVEKEMKITYK